jgi:Domain of unknown function (DUF4375)
MNAKLHRTDVSFADHWANLGHTGVIDDAAIETLCAPIEKLHPSQRPASYAWYYFCEVNNGGHAQYFMNLDGCAAPSTYVPEAIDGLRILGMESVADILAQAYLRWIGAARLAPADLLDASAIFQECEFEDLDSAFYAINMQDDCSNRPEEILNSYLRANQSMFVNLLPQSEADRRLVEMGDPSLQADGGRSMWLSLVDFPNACVRLKAARCLLTSDRDIALATARAIRADRAGMPWRAWVEAGDLLHEAGVLL